MNIEQLQMFLEVSELGSFQKVAERNFISQRAVSKRMRCLEEEVGVTLFNREQLTNDLGLESKFSIYDNPDGMDAFLTNLPFPNMREADQEAQCAFHFNWDEAVKLRDYLNEMVKSHHQG